MRNCKLNSMPASNAGIRPILMSAASVCAILTGRKVETRRIRANGRRPQFVFGDMLYMRETWRVVDYQQATEMATVQYRADGAQRAFRVTPNMMPKPSQWGKWRPGMFQPRWASRLLLIVRDARIERLHEITERGALAEGAESLEEFRLMWDEINGKRIGAGWACNPPVEVIRFRRGGSHYDPYVY